MQIKRKNKKTLKICIAIIFLGLTESCSNQKNRDFFEDMKPAYKDLKIDSASFFIKNYGLANEPTEIKGQNYWKMTCEKGSLFYAQGYLKMSQNSIVLMPIDYYKSITQQDQLLFDFNSMPNKSWMVYFETSGNMIYGDSIIFSGKRVGREGDTLHTFNMHPFYHFKANNTKRFVNPWFEVEVSRQAGIVSVAAIEANSDTLFYCTFNPLKLVDRRGGSLLF